VFSINQQKECVSENEVFARHKQTQFAFTLLVRCNSPTLQVYYTCENYSTKIQDYELIFGSTTQQHLKTPAYTQIRAAKKTTPARIRAHATALF
jgi:hypothetical protein